MKKLFFLAIVIIGFLIYPMSSVNAQGVGINSTNAPADPSAIFDASSFNKGALIPRMTSAQRGAIVNPAQGLFIYNTTTNCFNYYSGAGWFEWCGICIPPVIPTVSSNSPVCLGSSLNLSATSSAGSSYSWTGPNGFTSTIQNPSIANVTNSDSGTYSVIASLNNCNSPAGSTSVAVITVPAVPGTISGPTYGMGNQAGITYSISAVAGATSYTWTVPSSGATLTGGQGTTSITVDFGPSCSGDITVTASNSCGTSAPAGLSVATSFPVSCLAIQQDNPSAPSGIYTIDRGGVPTSCYCDMTTAGGGWTLVFQRRSNPNNVEACGAYLNEFIHNPCGSVSNLGYTDSYSMDFDIAPTPAKYLFVQYDASLVADVNDAYIVRYAGSLFPDNSPGRYDISINQLCDINDQNCYTGITWVYLPSGHLSSDQCSSTWGAPFSGIYGYCNGSSGSTNSIFGDRNTSYSESKLWDYNGASQWMERVFVRENCIPPASPSAGNNGPLCPGNTLNLTASTVTNATYSWTGPNGFTSNDQNPTIANVTVANSGTYSVIAIVSGCPSATATTTVLIPVPSTPGPISGQTAGVANQTGLVYSISPVPDATSYTWTVPSGATIANGQGTTSVTVDFGSNGGNITVTASNACGTSSASSLSVTAGVPSCAAIKQSNPSATDGIYTIDPGTGPIQCYCDMTTAGGGWTLVFQRRSDPNNVEACGSDLNNFIHNTCGSVSNLGYSNSYSMDFDLAPAHTKYLSVQFNSSMTADLDDAYIVYYSGSLFPDNSPGRYDISVSQLCNSNDQNCYSGITWVYLPSGHLSSDQCSSPWGAPYNGIYGYCNGSSGSTNSIFGDRNTAYSESKLWNHSGASQWMERVFVK